MSVQSETKELVLGVPDPRLLEAAGDLGCQVYGFQRFPIDH